MPGRWSCQKSYVISVRQKNRNVLGLRMVYVPCRPRSPECGPQANAAQRTSVALACNSIYHQWAQVAIVSGYFQPWPAHQRSTCPGCPVWLHGKTNCPSSNSHQWPTRINGLDWACFHPEVSGVMGLINPESQADYETNRNPNYGTIKFPYLKNSLWWSSLIF